MNELQNIRNYLGDEELLTQLAEEAAELSKAALKLRRAISGKNPTPVTKEDAQANLIEELSDVMLVSECFGISPDKEIQSTKLQRWVARLGIDEASDCAKAGSEEKSNDAIRGLADTWDAAQNFSNQCVLCMPRVPMCRDMCKEEQFMGCFL